MRETDRNADDDWLGELSDHELDAELLNASRATTTPAVETTPAAVETTTPAVESASAMPPVVAPAPVTGDREPSGLHDRLDAPEHRRGGRRALVGALIAAVAVLAVVAAAFGPQVVRNLSTEVVADDAAITLTNGGDTVTLVAPAGWHVVRPLGGGSEVALESPDGLAEFTFTLTSRPGAEAPPRLPAADSVGDDDWVVEPPTDVTTATYARLTQPDGMATGGLLGMDLFADGSPAHPGVVAAVAPEPPGASGAVVDVLGASDVAIEPYLGEFALIVASLEFAA